MKIKRKEKRLRFLHRHLRGDLCITPWEYDVDGKKRVGLTLIATEGSRAVTVVLNQKDALSLANYLKFYSDFMRTGAPYGFDSEERGLPVEATTNDFA